MEQMFLPISKLKGNTGQIAGLPKNPRVIRDERFQKLVQSIKDDPEMLSLRELIVYPYQGNFVVIAGNMRLRAIQELGYKECPVKVLPEDTPPEKLRAYTIKDNVPFGETDWGVIGTDWDAVELSQWGMELPEFTSNIEAEKESAPHINSKWIPDCLYPANNLYDIPTLRPELAATELTLPFMPYGVEGRTLQGVSTYHFYVDDYRFENIWNEPNKILKDTLEAIVEPNLSLYDTTPISYGLHLIYKKRWIARYLQTKGIKIFVDLNVSVKFQEYNLLGVPEGWNSFFTRGYSARIDYLKTEFEIAKRISQNENPNFVVYGGGKSVKEWCIENNLLYVEQLRGFDKIKEQKNNMSYG